MGNREFHTGNALVPLELTRSAIDFESRNRLSSSKALSTMSCVREGLASRTVEMATIVKYIEVDLHQFLDRAALGYELRATGWVGYRGRFRV